MELFSFALVMVVRRRYSDIPDTRELGSQRSSANTEMKNKMWRGVKFLI